MIIYLEDKRREVADWVPKLQHLVAGIPLFLSGLAHFHEEAERPMAILEMAVALIVIGTFVKELRAARRHAHSPVGWFDLAAGGLLIFEAFHGAQHKPGYLRPQFLSGIVTIGLGLFHTRIHHFRTRRRYLKLDDAGLELRVSALRRKKAAWSELASVDFTDRHLILRYKDGREHKIGLGRYRNRAAIEQGIAEHLPAGLLDA